MSQIPLWAEYYRVPYALTQLVSEEVKQWNPLIPEITNIHEYFQIKEKIYSLFTQITRAEPIGLKTAGDKRGEERVQAERKQWREKTKVQRQEEIKEQAKTGKFTDFSF